MPFTKSAKKKNQAESPHEMEKMIGMRQRNRLANLRRDVYSVEAHTCYRKINALLGDRNASDVAVETTLKVSARNPNHTKFTGSLKCPKNPHQKRAIVFLAGVALDSKVSDVHAVGFAKEIYAEMLIDNKKG